jgi:hypothetical protein
MRSLPSFSSLFFSFFSLTLSLSLSAKYARELELELIHVKTLMAQNNAVGRIARACVVRESKREESGGVSGRAMRLMNMRGVGKCRGVRALVFGERRRLFLSFPQ